MVGAVQDEGRFRLDLPIGLRFRHQVAHDVAGAGRRVFAPGHAGLQPLDTHPHVGFVVLEYRQVSDRRQLALSLVAVDVQTAWHEIEHVLGEQVQPLAEAALVQHPCFADVELHQIMPELQP